jgi:adenine-specific DNA-methyltransferase
MVMEIVSRSGKKLIKKFKGNSIENCSIEEKNCDMNIITNDLRYKHYQHMLKVLKQDERFFTKTGDILRNVIIEAALKFDHKLIKLLYNDSDMKKKYFVIVNGITIFDTTTFCWIINNRDFLPDNYTRFRNKIGLIKNSGNDPIHYYIHNTTDVELIFPYKDCILEGGQTKEDQERNEIFYNTTLVPDEIDMLLSPKVLTNFKKYAKNGIEQVLKFTDDDNLLIKGNNLIAINSLLERYAGKIKCIYIDPPYNPQSRSNTFSYNNSFNRSTWLTFMKNRLECAKKFLTKDGVLIVTIDKNEQPYLQILITEIFGSEYDIDCITIVHNPRGAQGKNFSYTHEFAIFVTPKGQKTICDKDIDSSEIKFSNLRNWGGESLRTDAANCFYPIIIKNENVIGFGDVMYDLTQHPNAQTVKKGDCYYIYPIDAKGIERKWRYARQSVEEIKDLLKVRKSKNGGYEIELGKNFGSYKTVWVDSKYDANEYGTKLLYSLIGENPFSYPKSLYAVIDCINSVVKNDKNAIILDFFAGSGTTAHAVCEINKIDGGNRKFILCEQMDYIETVTAKRIHNVIKEMSKVSFVYCELKELNQYYVNKLQEANTEMEIWNIGKQIISSGFINNFVSIKEIDHLSTDYKVLSLSDKKRLFMDILDMNMLYVNLCDIDDADYKISYEDKKLNKMFYGS